MSLKGSEKFLLDYAGWYINEFAPPPGSNIEDAAAYACAAIMLGSMSVVFRFNGQRIEVTSKDTPEGIVRRFYAALEASK